MKRNLGFYGYVALGIYLSLGCSAFAQISSESEFFKRCMSDKTKVACNTSAEICTFFLSEVGQRQAKNSCLDSERYEAAQKRSANEAAHHTPVKKPRSQEQNGTSSPKANASNAEVKKERTRTQAVTQSAP